MSSVRFICEKDIHIDLEQKLSNFLGTEDTILCKSGDVMVRFLNHCSVRMTAVFQTLLIMRLSSTELDCVKPSDIDILIMTCQIWKNS